MGISAALAGCDAPSAGVGGAGPGGAGGQPKVYASVADCAADHDKATCDSAWDASVAEQSQTAPHYAQRSACEAEYGVGRCEGRQGSGGWIFMPMMAGFMVGQMMRGRDGRPNSNSPPGAGYSGGGGGGGSGGFTGRPVFYSSNGGYRTPAARPGETFLGRGVGATGVTERGGFGRSLGFHFGAHGG
ncbi:MAG: DUF1190 domain-containing protein [Caulobacteraceae bacterium]|nr:DUF1190 domain-containing protein [Caulobacteraceae bacterium]